MQEVKNIKGVKAAAPFVNTQAVSMSGSGVSGIIIKGIDADLEKTVSKISSFITFGSLDDIKVRKEGEPYGILLGKDLAFSLMAGVGDTITLISPQLNRGPFGLNPKMRSFIVKGIFDTGVYEYNASMAYISIEAAQEFIGLKENSVTGISVSAEQGINSIDLTLFSALELEKYAMFIVLTLIIIVASFSIVSMIAITVKDKQKDIAILRAYGASSSCIRSIFMGVGLIVGIIGTALGNLVALFLSVLVTKYKLIKLPVDIYFMDSLPINIDANIYFYVSVCAVLITFLASLFPSNQSAKMNIVDGIRND